MKKLRRILTTVLASAFALSMFAVGACSGSGSKKELVVMTWHGPYDSTQYYQGYKYLEEEYEKLHKDVDVVLRSEPDAQYTQILDTGFSGGTAPDIILMKSAQRSTYLSDLLDLTPYFLEKSAYSDSDRRIDDFIGGISGRCCICRMPSCLWSGTGAGRWTRRESLCPRRTFSNA